MRYTSTRCFSIFAGICILVCGLLPRAIAQDSNPPQDSGSFSPQQETYSQAEYDAVYQEVIDSRPNCRVTCMLPQSISYAPLVCLQ